MTAAVKMATATTVVASTMMVKALAMKTMRMMTILAAAAVAMEDATGIIKYVR